MKNILCLIFLISSLSFSQEMITISGNIKDADTGETLIGASIYVPKLQLGTSSNNYGWFSITVPAGQYPVKISYIGYISENIVITNERSSFEGLSIKLKPTSTSLKEVKLKDKRKDISVRSTDVGKIELEMSSIEQLPVLAGEKDILKSIQLLPGIQSGGEGSAGFFVRGGSADQNLILLDEAVVYNASHLFGFFSVFNSDAIKNIELSKGSMPANYGGRLSSVLDISMKDGNNQKYSIEGGIGLIASRITLQGPIKKDTSSFIISARRTYIDVLTRGYIDTTSFAGSGYHFYDLTTKANYKISEKDHIFLSGYFGRDVFTFNSQDWGFQVRIPWGNATASLRWARTLNERLFVNNSIIFTDYKFELNGKQELEDTPTAENTLFSGIRDWNIKTDFTYIPKYYLQSNSENHTIKFGTNYVYHKFNPTSFYGSYDEFELEQVIYHYAHEYAAYFNDEWAINDKIQVNCGLRYSGFTQVGPFDRHIQDDSGQIGQVATDSIIHYDRGEVVQNYGGLEPRFSMRYWLDNRKFDRSSLKFAFVQNYQYLHLTSQATSSLPTDVWLPSSDIVKPQFGRQICLGYYENFNNDTWTRSVEFYYKKMKNLVEYNEDYTPGIAIGIGNVDNNLTFGDGESYGAELFIKRDAEERLNGSLSYTLSKTTRNFDELNNGNSFYAKYDRTHDLSFLLNYKITDRLILSTVFEYKTGNSLTIPKSVYIINGELLTEWGDRNSYRMAPYHRMDVSLTFKNKATKKYQSDWVLSIYNLYNRQNPYFIYFETEGRLGGDEPVKITAQQVSLFPIIPSISWNFKF